MHGTLSATPYTSGHHMRLFCITSPQNWDLQGMCSHCSVLVTQTYCQPKFAQTTLLAIAENCRIWPQPYAEHSLLLASYSTTQNAASQRRLFLREDISLGTLPKMIVQLTACYRLHTTNLARQKPLQKPAILASVRFVRLPSYCCT